MEKTDIHTNDTQEDTTDLQIQKTSRQYKDTLFRSLFSDGQKFLELYNAVADESYPGDTDVTPKSWNDEGSSNYYRN